MQKKKKEQEALQFQKTMIKDSLRIAYLELGKIHYQYGFYSDAIKSWARSIDNTTLDEEHMNTAYLVSQACVEAQTPAHLTKYIGEAEARDKILPMRDPVKSNNIKVIDALNSIFHDNQREAAIKIVNNISI